MFPLKRFHNIISRPPILQGHRFDQLLVMVMLAVPVCCYELAREQGNCYQPDAETTAVGHDECPCCQMKARPMSITARPVAIAHEHALYPQNSYQSYPPELN